MNKIPDRPSGTNHPWTEVLPEAQAAYLKPNKLAALVRVSQPSVHALIDDTTNEIVMYWDSMESNHPITRKLIINRVNAWKNDQRWIRIVT